MIISKIKIENSQLIYYSSNEDNLVRIGVDSIFHVDITVNLYVFNLMMNGVTDESLAPSNTIINM